MDRPASLTDLLPMAKVGPARHWNDDVRVFKGVFPNNPISDFPFADCIGSSEKRP